MSDPRDRLSVVGVEDVRVAGEERAIEVAPRKVPTTPREWIRDNLFSSWFNGVVTVVTAALVGYFGYQLLRWVFVGAEWGVVRTNLASYMLGRFPRAEAWRVWAGLYLAVLLAGLSWGVLGKRISWAPLRVGLAAGGTVAGVLLLLFLLEGTTIWRWIGGALGSYLAGVGIGKLAGARLRGAVWVGWILLYPVVVAILLLGGGPSTKVWGGLLLNVMVASVVIVASFPIGVLLALGRRSSFPVIRTFCVGVIELIRGVPLITLLLTGVFVLPLLLPPQLDVPTLIRVMIMFTLFSAVYIAEIVRGGLQGVHFGQVEAGRALGLPTWRLSALIVLPQALRNTIPAMISHFVSVWKDTALLSLVAGFVDLLASARRASAGLEFIGTQKEALLGAALIFWAVAISLGRWSQRVERRVGVGER